MPKKKPSRLVYPSPAQAACTLQLAPDTCWRLNGETLRILGVAPNDPKRVRVFRVDTKGGMPKEIAVAALEEALNADRLKPVSPPSKSTDRPSPSDYARTIAQSRMRLIQRVLLLPAEHPDHDLVYDSQCRGELIARVAKEYETSESYVRKVLQMWWRDGMNISSLYGNSHRCGRILESTPGATFVTDRVGRTSHLIVAAGTLRSRGGGVRSPRGANRKGAKPYAVSSQEIQQFLDIAGAALATRGKAKISEAVSDVFEQLYCLRDRDDKIVFDSKGNVTLLPPGQRPSERQVEYRLKALMNSRAMQEARNGAANHHNNSAVRTGSAKDDTAGPGDVYEIDSTRHDVFLVSRTGRLKLQRKFTLYLISDRSTQLIVSFYVTLLPPSAIQFLNALATLATNWEEKHKEWGIPYNPEAWPAQMLLCRSIFMDQGGDGKNKRLILQANFLELRMMYAPGCKSSDKGSVEGAHNSTQSGVSGVLPGSETSMNARCRRRIPVEKKACITLEEIRPIIAKQVAKINTTPSKGRRTRAQIEAGSLNRPIDRWRERASTRGLFAQKIPSAEWLHRQLNPRDTALVLSDGTGISFKGLRYECPEFKAEEWHRRLSGNKANLTVIYDPELCDHIAIELPKLSNALARKGNGYTYATLVSEDDSWKGHSFAEVKDWLAAAGKDRPAIEQARLQAQVSTRAGIRAITTRAQAELQLEQDAHTLVHGRPMSLAARKRAGEAAFKDDVAASGQSRGPGLQVPKAVAAAAHGLGGGQTVDAQPAVPAEAQVHTSTSEPAANPDQDFLLGLLNS